MTTPTNAQRAADIAERLNCDDGDAQIIDALTNLRHLCDREGFDFARLDRIAYQHYLEEKTP